MADNLTMNPGSGGSILRADQIPVELTYVPYSKILDATADSVNALIVNSSGQALTLATISGTPAVTISGTATVSGTVTANAGTGTMSVNQAQVAGTATDVNSGNKSAGTQRVVLATDQPQLTNAFKVDPSGVTSPVSIAATVLTQQTPGTSGGYSVSRLLSAATTNATSVKGSAGQVYGWMLFNTSASTKFFKLYNKATAPTVGTDTPFMTVPIPSGGGVVADFDGGIAMGTGIGFAITGAVADNDSTAVAANDVIVNLFYK